MFFLYHRKSFRTGQVLARALGLGRNEFGKNPLGGYPDVLIRWGNAQAHLGAQQTINAPEAINNASDKLRALRLMSEAGVRVPQFSTDPGEIDYPAILLGRDRRGFGGRDIVVYPTINDWQHQPHDFFTKYIEPHYEARIHVAFGEVIRVQKKYLDHAEDRTNEYIRNYANGYRFRSPRQALNGSRTRAAIEALSALGLDFGAVDLIVGTDRLEYVLEVNTAPKCSPLTGRAYIDAFSRRLGTLGQTVTPNYNELERLRTDG